MKIKGWLIFLMIILSLFGLAACAEGGDNNAFEQITAEKAKEIIDSKTECIILDVRTAEEFDTGHIEGALLLDYEDIGSKAHVVLPDKDALILVYCRSGRRSKIAANELVSHGYTNIKEFGGIIDWPYGIVK